jgi:hypothetical protein
MILLSPVNFDYTTAIINSEYASSTSSYDLVNLGPGNVLWRSIARVCPHVSFSMIDWSAASTTELTEPPSPNIPASVRNGTQREPIAIVGMALKFPQADNASELWNILEKGLNTVSEVCLQCQIAFRGVIIFTRIIT